MSKFEPLYASFSKHTKPKSIDACKCCVNADEITLLLGKNLREISAAEISNYASSVFLTAGSKSDFMYFFPRILELSLTDKFNWPDPEVVFNSVLNSEYDSWSEYQKDTVNFLLKDKFNELFETDEDGSDIEQWLCAISRVEPSISYYLDLIENHTDITVLHRFVDWNSDAIPSNKLANEFWDKCPEQEKQVVVWLRQGKSAKHLYDMYGMRM